MVEQGPQDPSRRRFLRLAGNTFVASGITAVSLGVGVCASSDRFDIDKLR